jgi:hypothetical protein
MALWRAVVLRGILLVLVAVLVALLAGGFGSSPPPVRPGGKTGTMTLVRGIERRADDEIWRFCKALIPKPGRYRRTCFVPRVERLFIGYGEWERTQKALDSVWRQLRWALWFDGRRVDLPRFGTSERTLYAPPGAAGKNVILREWSVNVVRVTSGKHVIRYRIASRSRGTTDAIWTLNVR